MTSHDFNSKLGYANVSFAQQIDGADRERSYPFWQRFAAPFATGYWKRDLKNSLAQLGKVYVIFVVFLAWSWATSSNFQDAEFLWLGVIPAFFAWAAWGNLFR